MPADRKTSSAQILNIRRFEECDPEALNRLPESEQNAVLDWLEEQMRIHRQQVLPPPRTERRVALPGS